MKNKTIYTLMEFSSPAAAVDLPPSSICGSFTKHHKAIIELSSSVERMIKKNYIPTTIEVDRVVLHKDADIHSDWVEFYIQPTTLIEEVRDES